MLVKKKETEKGRGVESPLPGAVFGGNGCTLMGSKGPYYLILFGRLLIPGLHILFIALFDGAGCSTGCTVAALLQEPQNKMKPRLSLFGLESWYPTR